MTTFVPTSTRLYKSITSMLRMRMQPDDAARPIFSGFVGAVDAVEWVAVAGVKIERAGAERAFRPARDGTHMRPALFHLGWRFQAGHSALRAIRAVPVQPNASSPTVTP